MMIGHGWARDLLRRAARRGRLGHAYLLQGAESVGKTALAIHLGSMLVCTGPEPRPCGVCRACRQVTHGGHPDVRLVERAADRRDITIDQVRQLEEDIVLAPFQAARKLICIAGADTLNDAAASALLKTLEEPPPQVTLVLTAADPLALPSTVRSRCQTLALQPIAAHAIADGLMAEHSVQPGQARDLAILARGRPGWAVRALAAPDLVEKERADLALVAGLANSGPYSRLLAVETWLGKGASFVESRDRALSFCALLETWWRDALLASQGAALPALRDHLVGDVGTASFPASEIVAFLLRVQETALRVEANVTPRLALEHLLMAMPGTRGKAHAGAR